MGLSPQTRKVLRSLSTLQNAAPPFCLIIKAVDLDKASEQKGLSPRQRPSARLVGRPLTERREPVLNSLPLSHVPVSRQRTPPAQTQSDTTAQGRSFPDLDIVTPSDARLTLTFWSFSLSFHEMMVVIPSAPVVSVVGGSSTIIRQHLLRCAR